MAKTKILIVDDELVTRESLAGWLERDGHQSDTGRRAHGLHRYHLKKAG